MQEERITSRSNRLITHIRKLLSSRSYRTGQGMYVCDGVKMLEEALRWHAGVTTVVAVEGLALPALADGVRVVRVPGDVMQSVSPMESPQGVLFLTSMAAQAASAAIWPEAMARSMPRTW